VPIRIKVAEDLPAEVADLLQAGGHDVRTVVQEGLTGAHDDQVWGAAQQEGRCLLTADKGFANAQIHPPGTHRGIVLLRLPRESRAGYVHLVERLLADLDFESAAGAIIVATPEAIRIHRGA